MLRMLVAHLSAVHRRCRTASRVGTLTSGLFSELAVACSNTWGAILVARVVLGEREYVNKIVSSDSDWRNIMKEDPLEHVSYTPDNVVLLCCSYFLRKG